MQHESIIRLAFFFGVLVVMASWEAVAPRRKLSVGRGIRWLTNLSLVVINILVGRLVFALGAVGVALVAEERGWGLFNNVDVPRWLVVVLSVVALDFIIYLQHVMFHAVPTLWRLHMVHHADRDIDVTTGTRFHTIEILISLGIKVSAILLLGVPALGVLVFEVILNATAMFNHSNVRLPLAVDRVLRLFVVTPDMHRVHHSVIVRETNSNFGFNLPWWDFLMGTYRSQPAEGHDGMEIGLAQFRGNRATSWLHWLLLLPFFGDRGNQSIDGDR